MKQIFILSLLASLVLPAQAEVDVTKTAVVIIDMQYGFYDRGGVRGMPGLEALVKRQQELLSWAVEQKVPVLVFEYDEFGDTNTRLTDLLKGHPHQVILKVTDGAFDSPTSSRPTERILEEWKVTNLIVSGINGDACVHATVTGALKSGFSVITSSDIVGNLNVNPPIYPNDTWFDIEHENFTVADDLDAIIH